MQNEKNDIDPKTKKQKQKTIIHPRYPNNVETKFVSLTLKKKKKIVGPATNCSLEASK